MASLNQHTAAGIAKYNARADKTNSLLCVGLDPELEKIPERFRSLAQPQFQLNKWIIEQTHEHAAAYKPNIAFYESRGPAGLTELKLTIDFLRENYPDIFLICDAKRVEVENTMKEYAKELFDFFGFDAVTVDPYFGGKALASFLDRSDKVPIILCRSSNPGAGDLQDLQVSGKPLWQVVAEKTRDEWNQNGNCMLMIGATYPEEMRQARALVGDMTFLVPGLGAQGGDTEAAVRAGLNSAKKGMIINSSRGIIFADNPGEEARKLKEEINKFRN